MPMPLKTQHVLTPDYGVCIIIYDDDGYFLEHRILRPFFKRLYKATRSDDREKFINLVKDEYFTGSMLRQYGYIICPSFLLSTLMNGTALSCAEALVSGLCGVQVDLDHAPNPRTPPPIFQAAHYCFPELIDLFIKHGASVNTPNKSTAARFKFMLPLDAAIEGAFDAITSSAVDAVIAASFNPGFDPDLTPAVNKATATATDKIQWSAQSVDDFVFKLSSIPKVIQGCRGVGHIMKAVPVEETQESIRYHANKGNILHLAIALYSDAKFGLGTFQKMVREEYITLYQSVHDTLRLSQWEGEKNLFYKVGRRGVSLYKVEDQVIKCTMGLLNYFFKFPVLGCGAEHERSLGDNVAAAENSKFHTPMDGLPPRGPFPVNGLPPRGPFHLMPMGGTLKNHRKPPAAGTFQASQSASRFISMLSSPIKALPTPPVGTSQSASRFTSKLSGQRDDDALPEALKATIGRGSLRLRTARLFGKRISLLHIFLC